MNGRYANTRFMLSAAKGGRVEKCAHATARRCRGQARRQKGYRALSFPVGPTPLFTQYVALSLRADVLHHHVKTVHVPRCGEPVIVLHHWMSRVRIRRDPQVVRVDVSCGDGEGLRLDIEDASPCRRGRGLARRRLVGKQGYFHWGKRSLERVAAKH